MGMAFTNFLQANAPAMDIGSTLLGGGLQFAGAIGGGLEAQQQGTFQAAVLKNNALIAEEAAEAALERGKIETQERQVETAQTIGAQRATLAARGIVVDQDTAATLTSDTARIGKLDELTIQRNAQREALALKMQGISFRMQASSAKASGKSALWAGLLGGAGTLMGTATSVASKWAVYNKEALGN